MQNYISTKTSLLILALAFSFTLAKAQEKHSGIEFFHGTFAEAKALAAKENKMIFMDAYAEWCGPCKRMAATVFTEEKVGQFMNDNFINVKMDMEKGEGPTLSNTFDVSAYPTLLFIDDKGKLIQKEVGAYPAEQFIKAAQTALSKIDNTSALDKMFKDGSRDGDFLVKYVKALNRSSKPSQKIVNDYLITADFKKEATLRLIFEGTVQSDSKVFDYLIQNRTPITVLYGERSVQQKIETAIKKTADNATEFKTPELLSEAKSKMKKYSPQTSEATYIEWDMTYFKSTKDTKNYIKACDEYGRKEVKVDARKSFGLAKKMVESFPNDTTVLIESEKYFKRAAETGGMSEYYFWYANTLLHNSKKDQALKMAETGLKIAQDSQPNYVRAIEDLIRKIKEG